MDTSSPATSALEIFIWKVTKLVSTATSCTCGDRMSLKNGTVDIASNEVYDSAK